MFILKLSLLLASIPAATKNYFVELNPVYASDTEQVDEHSATRSIREGIGY